MSSRWLLAVTVAVSLLATAVVRAQDDDARNRQAAGQAYDRGTAAYLAGEYEKAAEWFETANRLSPAAPALMQAIRSHQRAGGFVRAASLALRLMQEYGDDTTAAEYAQGVLGELGEQFLRVDVVCDCQLELDGTLVEFHSFFLPPDAEHTLTAHFDTGTEQVTVSGAAGENKTVEIAAPAPTETEEPRAAIPVHVPDEPRRQVDDSDRKPLPPLAVFIGAGVTGALAIGATLVTLDFDSKNDEYQTAAQDFEDCEAASCDTLYEDAIDKQSKAKSAETLRNVLWIATGGAAVLTGAAALLLTDWEGDGDDDDVALGLLPTPTGIAGTVRARW